MNSPDLARPIAPHRLRAYGAVLSIVGAVFAVMTVAEAFRLLPPTRTVDVVANLIFGIPVIAMPLIFFWNHDGERRSTLQKWAELTLIYIPLTAGSQFVYELPFILGHPFNLWVPTPDPGWRWLWWQYGLADTRYRSDNNWIFGLELASVLVGILLTVMWFRLLRKDLPDEARIKALFLTFFGVTVLATVTVSYYVAEIRAGFNDIGQGAYGLWFKFVGENVPYIILPFFVLFGIFRQIDYLVDRRVGSPASAPAVGIG